MSVLFLRRTIIWNALKDVPLEDRPEILLLQTDGATNNKGTN